jgi:hypothetical protein
MPLRTLRNVLRSLERRAVLFSRSASPAVQTIYEGLDERRRIIGHLKRYEDVTYTFVARRFASLRQEMAVILHAPGNRVLPDRRVQERRKVRRSARVMLLSVTSFIGVHA